MRIWVDGQCFQTASRFRGIGRYVRELVAGVSEAADDIELMISFNAGIGETTIISREIASEWLDPRNIYVWHGAAVAGEALEGYSFRRRLSEVAIAHHVNCLKPDIALSASPFEGLHDKAVPLLPSKFCSVPLASIFYDAIPLRFPEKYLADAQTAAGYARRLAAFEKFSINLCISKFSQDELTNRFPLSKAVNIAAGVSPDLITLLRNKSMLWDARAEYGTYLLYVGGLDWRKNVGLIVDAFALLPAALQKGLKLVIAGDHPKPLLVELVSRWTGYGLSPDQLIHRGHVSESDLAALYTGAVALVQPSLMEGFGLTALEAMTCGTVAIASRTGALPEVVGANEALFDPSSSEELSALLQRILSDKQFVRQLTDGAVRQSQEFSWSRSASIAVEALREASSAGLTTAGCEASRIRIANNLNLPKSERQLAAAILSRAETIADGPSRLVVDATATVRVDHATGIQRVVKHICREFTRKVSPEREKVISFCIDENGWYDAHGRLSPNAIGEPRSKLRFRQGDTVLMLDSSWDLYRLHTHHLRAFRMRGIDVVSCLYDTVPLRTPAFCDPGMPPVFSQWFQTALTYSTGFVCISRAVADELLAILEAISYPRRMKVGYWQLGADFIETKDEVPPRSAKRPLFLMVGTLEPRKGHRTALSAFEELWKAGIDAELVIVGKPGWGVELLVKQLRAHPEYGRRLVWHEKVDDQALASLYETCDALVAASFAEGFGLPIVEAGHFGKPVIASDIPVFREVAAGAASAHFFEAGASRSLAAAVKTFLGSREKDSDIPRRAAWPSWRESAAQLEEVVIGGNWYKTYEPRERKEYAPINELGHVRMQAPLDAAGKAHVLRLIDGPEPVENGSAFKITVAVMNRSSAIWSSHGAADGSLAVNLSFHVVGPGDAPIEMNNARTSIPFVHIPGDTHYAAVVVPAYWKKRGAMAVEIELVQEGVAWFGTPLRVAL